MWVYLCWGLQANKRGVCTASIVVPAYRCDISTCSGGSEFPCNVKCYTWLLRTIDSKSSVQRYLKHEMVKGGHQHRYACHWGSTHINLPLLLEGTPECIYQTSDAYHKFLRKLLAFKWDVTCWHFKFCKAESYWKTWNVFVQKAKN